MAVARRGRRAARELGGGCRSRVALKTVVREHFVNICFEKIEVGVIMASMDAINNGNGRGARPLQRLGRELIPVRRRGLQGMENAKAFSPVTPKGRLWVFGVRPDRRSDGIGLTQDQCSMMILDHPRPAYARSDTALARQRGNEFFSWPGRPRKPLTRLDSRKESEGN